MGGQMSSPGRERIRGSASPRCRASPLAADPMAVLRRSTALRQTNKDASVPVGRWPGECSHDLLACTSQVPERMCTNRSLDENLADGHPPFAFDVAAKGS